MRAIDIALATLALRSSGTRPQAHERRVVPAVDQPDAGLLDRNALPHARAALIASLWPPARQCVVPTIYAQMPVPAMFATALNVFWPARPVIGARALQAKLNDAFPQAETAPQHEAA